MIKITENVWYIPIICHLLLFGASILPTFAVWGGASHALLTKLERVQLKIAPLLVTPAHRHLSGKLLLEAANLPTLAWRRREHRLTILWKLINNLGRP